MGGNAAQIIPSSHRFTHFQIQIINNAVTDIYFPIDGRQPTTHEAIQWSGANVNDVAVTEWYMMMFGWTNQWGQTLNMGFTPPGAGGGQAACPILSMGPTMVAPQNLIPQFLHAFREIASNPVGRILLYRLLIEIRRTSLAPGTGGVQEGVIPIAPQNPVARNCARSLIVNRVGDFNNWSYTPASAIGNGVMDCSFGQWIVGLVVKNKLKNGHDHLYTNKIFLRGQLSNCLFHEMLHWYQQLRYFDRFNIEHNQIIPPTRFPVRSLPYDYYYQNAYTNGQTHKSWSTPIPPGPGGTMAVDELRVRCGRSSNGMDQFFEGDDLSENAFRCLNGWKLLFGNDGEIKLDRKYKVDEDGRAILCAYRNASRWINMLNILRN
ncbi:MAG: mitochondrial inner membrane protease ATP23 [Holosporales bacterium]|nr:mitochondrial inner membrane protease ATP23 [Holosporales bacterium]